MTNAAAKVGDYPFTTLRPQLGVVRHKGREFVIADIPGLIEGAAEGAGVGDRFLGHVERTRLLLHLVDASGDDPAEAYRIVRDELASYGAGLDLKPEIVALTKADMLDAEAAEEDRASELEAASGVETLSRSPHRSAKGSSRCSTRSSNRSATPRGRRKRTPNRSAPWSPL